MKREEAIKIIDCYDIGFYDLSGAKIPADKLADAFDMAIEALSDRPTDEWCTDCKEYDHEKHCCPRFNRVIRTTLNEAVANLKEGFESAVPNCQKCAIKELWKETEKEDLVEVVRCKDCRWYENRYGEVCHNPRYGDGHANYSPPYVDEEYFCKDGERSEE